MASFLQNNDGRRNSDPSITIIESGKKHFGNSYSKTDNIIKEDNSSKKTKGNFFKITSLKLNKKILFLIYMSY